jgi:hypothetical protein
MRALKTPEAGPLVRERSESANPPPATSPVPIEAFSRNQKINVTCVRNCQFGPYSGFTRL